MIGKREYGDYQTPIEFAKNICSYLKNNLHINPSAIIEPTCGIGSLLKSSLIFDAKEYYGIEINPSYCEICKESIIDDKVNIINANFFDFSFKGLVKDDRQILIIGNPPWVMNSFLSGINSENLPLKENFKKLKGLDALTGSSNFDICEYIILKLINEYKNKNTIIAMICKTSVARNVFEYLKRNEIYFSFFNILEFDSKKIFDINSSACVMVVNLVNKKELSVSSDICRVYDFHEPNTIKSYFGYLNGKLYSNLTVESEDFDGQCCFDWRQGVKHDCSKIMELVCQDNKFKNGLGELVDIEKDIVFPLVKSSNFKSPIINEFSKFVIVTQKRVREDTGYIQHNYPKTWNYLNNNIEFFNKRKSSIYVNSPLFSMFGIGDYSYSEYKVGISGFYKKPLFSLLYSHKKPVMLDDTSYFICFDEYFNAYVAMLLLNSIKVNKFLTSIAFLDSKRPYTKKLLSRIDFNKIIKNITIDELINTEESLKLEKTVNLSMYEKFKSHIKNINQTIKTQ